MAVFTFLWPKIVCDEILKVSEIWDDMRQLTNKNEAADILILGSDVLSHVP